MKTQTRDKIIKLIDKHGKVRPHDLRQTLKLSGAAIHQQLRNLVKQGIIDVKGKPPLTYYTLAGIPDFERVSVWFRSEAITKNPQDVVCETRDVFAGRLPRLKEYLKAGFPISILPLVISATGEIGNNSFDHNLGQWRDAPGCWFESQLSGSNLWICIADRGQGVFQSLTKNYPNLKSDQEALRAAFETLISGRIPERRGNGLKFVKNIITKTPGGGIGCISGEGCIHYGEQGEKCAALLNKHRSKFKGTMTLMVWSFK